jgi:hypothetical protein
MNIRHIISTIALGAGLGVAALAPVQAQAGEHRHERGGDRYEEHDRQDDRHAYRKDHRKERRHDGHHAYKHRKYARHNHRMWRQWKRQHGHHGYPPVCRLPKHRHYGHHPRGYGNDNVHGRVRYNASNDWRVVFKF